MTARDRERGLSRSRGSGPRAERSSAWSRRRPASRSSGRRSRQRAPGVPRVPEPPAVRRGAVAPDAGRHASSDRRSAAASVRVRASPIGQRMRVDGHVRRAASCEQDITLWDGIARVDFATLLDGFAGHDRLFRVRFGAAGRGGDVRVRGRQRGRGRGRSATPTSMSARSPFTLDNPAYDWFGLSATARVELTDRRRAAGEPYAAQSDGRGGGDRPDDPSLDEARPGADRRPGPHGA